MRKIINAMLICCLPLTLMAQKLDAPIKNVTLYLDGAKISRQLNTKLKSGEQTIVITDLSNKLESNTVRVNPLGNVKILSVTTRDNYLKKSTDGVSLEHLKDSIEILKYANLKIDDQLDALQMEKSVLLKNQIIGTKEDNTVAELKELAAFFSSRILKLNSQKTDLQIQRNKNEHKLFKYQSHLSSNKNVTINYFKEIIVVLKSDVSAYVQLDLEYIVGSAGWVPTYDIRVRDLSEPIVLDYRSQVFNNTGVNWKNVKFLLSTADPRKSATKPTLNTWVIKNNLYERDFNQSINASYSQDEKVTIELDGIEYEEVDIPELTMEFEIAEKYSIPSDAKPYLVDVTQYELSAYYKHYAVPKIEKAVFLLARISGWEDLNLIEGNANIYFGGDFVGESYIKTSGVSDTLDISLGRDSKVSIDRVKVKDYTDTKMIGGFMKDILEFEIMVKNLRGTPIEIEIQDQVPISGDDEITIALEEKDGAIHAEENGMLSWELRLDKGKTVSKDFIFSVKYPKNMSYAKQQSVRKVRAKF